MSNTVLILGESGAGKSTSLRTLSPVETFIIKSIDKKLPFPGTKLTYTLCSKENPAGNYFVSDTAAHIMNIIDAVDKRRLDIKSLVIDDFQYIMANEFMRKALEKGYGKFTEIGQNAWAIISRLMACRDDLDCFVLTHSDLDSDGKFRMKTIGKMLSDKITPEGMFTCVLHSLVVDGVYSFLTQNDGVHIAKSPMGMFEKKYIDNDLNYIKSKLSAYDRG